MSFTSLSEFVDGLLTEQIPVDDDIFELFLDYTQSVGVATGFEAAQLHELIKKLVLLDLRSPQMRAVFLYMIPKDNVLCETVDFIISWCFTSSTQTMCRKLIKPILKWLIALILLKIVDARHLKHTILILISLLNVDEVNGEICYLLYLILDHELLTEYTVKRLLNSKDSPSLLGVISLCKRLKPHLLKDFSIIKDEKKDFPKISQKLFQNICLWTKLCPEENNMNAIRFPNWSSNVIAFKNPRNGNITYLPERSLEQSFQDAKSYGIYYAGTSFDSLICNNAGFVYIALGGKRLEQISLEYIDRTLAKVENILNNRQEQAQTCVFLISVSNLQKFLQQTLLPVQRFLKRILKVWEATNYRKEILALLSGITIGPYEEFFKDILKPLYVLILNYDYDISCDLLHCLAALICNNVKYLSNPPILDSCQPPLKPKPEDIQRVEKCFKHFCLLFVNMNNENSVILHEIVDHHILLSTVQNQTDVDIDCLLPIGIFHQILINSDYVLINKVSRLLLTKYKSCCKDLPLPKQIAMQMSDILEIFFKTIFRSGIFNNPIRCPVIENKIYELKRVKHTFKLRNALAFRDLNHINGDGQYKSEKCKHEELRKRLHVACPDLAFLLKILVMT